VRKKAGRGRDLRLDSGEKWRARGRRREMENVLGQDQREKMKKINQCTSIKILKCLSNNTGFALWHLTGFHTDNCKNFQLQRICGIRLLKLQQLESS